MSESVLVPEDRSPDVPPLDNWVNEVSIQVLLLIKVNKT
jgi:hypothetical protein